MTFIKDESLKIYFTNKFFVIPYKIGYNWIFYYLFLQKRDNNKFPFKVPLYFKRYKFHTWNLYESSLYELSISPYK